MCSGSPAFLKQNFGHGFQLNLNKKLDFDESILKVLLEHHLTDYFVETNIASEMCIAVSAKDNYILPEFLVKIEEYRKELGIADYGISSTSIEEVFLKY